MKYHFFVLILFLAFISCQQKFYQPSKNEYGLIVLNTIEQYQYTIKKDSSKQLINLQNYIPHIQFNWYYATKNNFTKDVLYQQPTAYLRKEAADKLYKAAIAFKQMGLGIKVFDAYRPYTITKKMWQIVPDERYAANPAKGSGHNRGIAIDLTLYNLTTGEELSMPTAFDNFTEKAHVNYQQLDNNIITNRTLLINTMQQFGFIVLPTEWWHFYLPNAEQFEILDIDFKTLKVIR